MLPALENTPRSPEDDVLFDMKYFAALVLYPGMMSFPNEVLNGRDIECYLRGIFDAGGSYENLQERALSIMKAEYAKQGIFYTSDGIMYRDAPRA